MTGGGASGVSGTPFTDWLAADGEVAELVRQEAERQTTTLQLIASENFTSPAVLAADRDRCSPTSTPRATRVAATTAATR